MIDNPTPTPNESVQTSGPDSADQQPAAKKTSPTKRAVEPPVAPVPATKPRGMTYGGISAAQHALERQERAGLWQKNGRRDDG